jgi:hypothetical protein
MFRVNIAYILIFLVPLLKITCTGCEDPLPQPADVLPPVTTEGKGTFGCKVNGKVWVKHGSLNCDWYLFKDIPSLNGSFAVSSKNFEETISVYHEKIWSKGIYKLDSFISFGNDRHYFAMAIASIKDENLGQNAFYRVTPSVLNEFKVPGTGTLNILRLDSISRIISGTFEFVAKNERDTTDKLIVTEGRFDVKF